ncbi:hypothetical protein [Streptomyces sp. NPDC012746]|uniref:hypothetical protein n=1 Tax=Streptomyces sp. NPDC012746 TaxID=3364845 RepID=UPI0036AA1151
MTITNPDLIPATPVYTITVSADGAASVNGERVTDEGLDPSAARVAALAEVRIKAAFYGRPVRVIAKEADGSAWPLIVAVDGSVTTLDHPHPTPPPTAPTRPAEPLPAPRSAPTPAPRTDAAQQSPPPASDAWGAPLPEPYRPLWETLVAQERAESLVEAIVTADRLEQELSKEYGTEHPHTLNVLNVRAWLTLRNTTEWAETTELLIEAAERLLAGGAPVVGDNIRIVRSAHGAWRELRAEDTETARELVERLLAVLDALVPLTGRAEERDARARDVLNWAQSGAARPGAA